ncbi:MAG: DUF4132 domain-containing protein [Gallionella sp.]
MRRFEYIDDKSSKFWQVNQVDKELHLHWGRIGTAGQSQSKQFDDHAKAEAAMLKLVKEKTGKGYVEVGISKSNLVQAAAIPVAPLPINEALPVIPTSTPAPNAAPPETASTPPIHSSDSVAIETSLSNPEPVSESVDQQTERVLFKLLGLIAENQLELGNAGLTEAKIRSLCEVGELAAEQVRMQLITLFVLNYGYKNALLAKAASNASLLLQIKPATPPEFRVSGQVPPWMERGEPIYQDLSFRVMVQLPSYPLNSSYRLTNNQILLERGCGAVEHFASQVGNAYVGGGEESGHALTCIGTPEAIEVLAKVANTCKAGMMRLRLAIERWPLAAMAALSRLQAGNHKNSILFAPALAQLVRNYPQLVAQVSPWLEPAANAVLAKLQLRLSQVVETASNDELPPVLAQAPWLQPQPASQPLKLEPLALAAVEVWQEDEKNTALTINQWLKNRHQNPDIHNYLGELDINSTSQPADFALALQAIENEKPEEMIAVWRKQAKQRLEAYALACLPPVVAIPFWNTIAREGTLIYIKNISYLAAKLGLPALPGLISVITGNPADHLSYARNYGCIELAPLIARTFVKIKAQRALAREWLLRFPEHAVCALIAPALGKPCEAQYCAASVLRWLNGHGQTELLQQVAQRYQRKEVMDALNGLLNENPLNRYPGTRAKLPEFWCPNDWARPLLMSGKALPEEALNTLGTMLTFPSAIEVYAGVFQVKQACQTQSLADFAWDCFSAWLNAGASGKESWALTALGWWGNDDTARKLTPYLRAWPGESAHARAVTGLDVLANIGSDVALMLLNGIAQKSKFKGLQERANEKIAAIAETRGLTSEELDDRLVPDLGLDERGSLILDFGPRAFKVGFDESLKPYVREWLEGKMGARLKDLPKPNKSDNAELADSAVEQYKLLKKDARTLASQQFLRLERAMCSSRRWPLAVFEQFIAHHPLVCHLARLLVWGIYVMPEIEIGDKTGGETRYADFGGELHNLFRVTEDGEYSNAADDGFELPSGAQYKIGLPHALELSATQTAEFAQLFTDYELIQPFRQLGRETYGLTTEEKLTTQLTRWQGLKVPTGKILGLVNNGWRRSPALDGGCIGSFEKVLNDQRVIELRLEPGIIVGMVNEYPEQTLQELIVGSGSSWGYSDKLDAFTSLDDITASELIRDMERLG